MDSTLGRIVRCRENCLFQTRKAAAVVEFAIVLPVLLIIFVAAVDFARVFYNAQVLTDCARTAALFAANPDLAHRTSYESVVDLARTCVADLDPQPTFSFTNGTDIPILLLPVVTPPRAPDPTPVLFEPLVNVAPLPVRPPT